MSTQLLKSRLSAEWHNVLLGLQGLVFVVAAIHNDLPNILSQVQSWIPMIGSIAGLIYHKKAELSAAFDKGQTATITQTSAELATVLTNPSADINAIRATASKIVGVINAANAS